MSKQTVIIVAAAILLWLLLRKDQSYAETVASSVAGGKLPPAPAFGTDHIIDAADAFATQPLTLPPPRSLEQVQTDFSLQLQNPAYQAAAANPSVAASNAYNGQFIGKIS